MFNEHNANIKDKVCNAIANGVRFVGFGAGAYLISKENLHLQSQQLGEQPCKVNCTTKVKFEIQLPQLNLDTCDKDKASENQKCSSGALEAKNYNKDKQIDSNDTQSISKHKCEVQIKNPCIADIILIPNNSKIQKSPFILMR